MIIYKDIFSGDEMFTDSYPVTEEDDFFYKVKGKMTTEKDDVDESKLGANASAEGADADEGGDTVSKTGVNIVLANRLVETGFTKKTYTPFIKAYVKSVKEYLEKNKPERVEAFQKAAPAGVKKIMSKIGDLQFFTGESLHDKCGIGYLEFDKDDDTPYMYFFKDGLDEEKA